MKFPNNGRDRFLTGHLLSPIEASRFPVPGLSYSTPPPHPGVVGQRDSTGIPKQPRWLSRL